MVCRKEIKVKLITIIRWIILVEQGVIQDRIQCIELNVSQEEQLFIQYIYLSTYTF